MFNLLLQAGEAAPKGNMLGSILPFVVMFAILYFLMIRPQRKKQKELQLMLDEVKINDEIITTGGILGKIANIKKEKGTVVIKVDDNTKLEIQRGAIGTVVKKSEK
jgi:preprotein translocase subunit YajC